MKIGIFSDTYYPQINGVGTSIRILAQGLRAQGHRVYIFTPSDPRLEEESEEDVFRIPSMPFLFAKTFRAGLACPPQLLAKIRALELDVIHTQTEFSLGFLGKLIAKTFQIPLVHTYHTMYEDYVHYIARGHLITQEMAREFSRRFCTSTRGVIVPTEKTRELLASYGVEVPIAVIPTGIDMAHFKKENHSEADLFALRESLGLSADTPVLLSLGRIAQEKSIDVIVRALPKLLEEVPQVQMVLVGDGPAREELEALGEALGVAEHMIFVGAKPWSEIGMYYRLGNVFCSASTSETQGLTFAEAMAAGVPVVAKKDPCIEGIVQHEQTGFLFEDEIELVQYLKQVLMEPSLATKLVEEGFLMVQQLSVEQFASSVLEVYEAMCEGQTDAKRFQNARAHWVKGKRMAKGMVIQQRRRVGRRWRKTKHIAHRVRSKRKES